MTTITSVSFPIPKSYIIRFFTKGKNIRTRPATCLKGIKPREIREIDEILQRLNGSGERNG